MFRTKMLPLLAIVALSLTVAAGRFFGDSIAFAKTAGKVTICHKPGTPAEKTMQVPASAVAGHLAHGDVLGPCLTGVDTFPSGGSITLLPPIVLNPEIVTLSSAGRLDAIITRQQLSGEGIGRDKIETEMVSLELVGTSSLGPVSVRVGSSFGLPASTGEITNIVRAEDDGSFRSGDSFFDVFFEIEIGPIGEAVIARNEEPVRLDARNRATKKLAPITSLPPNDPEQPDPNAACIEYAEDVLAQTGGLITDVIHIPFVNDPDSVCGPRGHTTE